MRRVSRRRRGGVASLASRDDAVESLRRRRGVVATTPRGCRVAPWGCRGADANRPQVPRRRHRGGRHRAGGALHVVPAAGVGRPRDGRRRGRGLPAPPRAAALDVSRGRRRRVVGLPRRLICVYSLYSLCIVHECERPAPDICVCRYPSLTRANRPQASSWVAAPGSGCPRSRRRWRGRRRRRPRSAKHTSLRRASGL